MAAKSVDTDAPFASAAVEPAVPALRTRLASMLARLDAAAAEALRQGDMAGTVRALLHKPLLRSIVTFLAVGLVGLASDATVFALLDARHIAPEWARAASLAVATVVTWSLNRSLTFARSGRAPGAEILRYVAVTCVAQGISYGLFLLLVYEIPSVPRLIWLVTGAVVAAAASFLGHKFFAFAPATPPEPQRYG